MGKLNLIPQKPQGAVIVGYLIGYDPSTTHVKMHKDPATVAASIISFLERENFAPMQMPTGRVVIFHITPSISYFGYPNGVKHL